MRKVLVKMRRSGRLSRSAARALFLSVAVVTLFGVALRGEENQTSTLPLQADTPVSVEGIEIREAAPGAELRIRAAPCRARCVQNLKPSIGINQ